MKAIREEFTVAAKPTKRKPPRHKTTRDCPRVTLRLSPDDHERLKELAGSMALSTYIRAKALGLDLPRRELRSSASVVDKQAIAQILGLLGQSRIANNLNQLQAMPHPLEASLLEGQTPLAIVVEVVSDQFKKRVQLFWAIRVKNFCIDP